MASWDPRTWFRTDSKAPEAPPVGLARLARADGMQNPYTGLGTSRDKAAAAMFQADCPLDPDTCEALTTQDDIAGKIVELPVKEIFRAGWNLKIEGDTDQKLSKAFDDAEKTLEFMPRVRQAWTWARALGGGILYVNADDGRLPSEPLNELAIRRINSLTWFDRRFARPLRYYNDPKVPEEVRKFGTPRTYSLTSYQTGAVMQLPEIHESRCIRFGGALTGIRAKIAMAGWDYSVLQRPWNRMVAFEQAVSSIDHSLTDFSQGVWKIAGLFNMIASGQSEMLATRMRELDRTRSVARSVIVDKDGEDFTNVARQFGGVPELLEFYQCLLASGAGMPVTRLFGRSPAGMNATGESDEQIWHESLGTQRTDELLPPLSRLYRLISLAKEGPTAGREVAIEVCFKPFRAMSDNERATLEKTTADKDKVYIDAGVLTPEEVAMSRFGGGEWSPETTIDVDARQAAQEAGESFDPYPADPEPDPVVLPPGTPGSTPPADGEKPPARDVAP